MADWSADQTAAVWVRWSVEQRVDPTAAMTEHCSAGWMVVRWAGSSELPKAVDLADTSVLSWVVMKVVQSVESRTESTDVMLVASLVDLLAESLVAELVD
jgi:hypothetical protein